MQSNKREGEGRGVGERGGGMGWIDARTWRAISKYRQMRRRGKKEGKEVK